MKNPMQLRAALALAAIVLSARAGVGEESKTSAHATIRRMHEEWVAAGKTRAASVQPKFGIDNVSTVNLHAYQFLANTSTDLINDDGNGYRYFGAPAVPFMAAPLTLPPGARIDTLGASYCTETDGDLVFTLLDNGTAGGSSVIVGQPVFSQAGCRTTISGFGGGANYDVAAGHPLYLVVYFAGGGTEGATKFNAVWVSYARKVSPPPAQPTFGDVPASDFGFQYVEALAASGITGGCGAGNYCPDSSVTRRQMAIFIAKALALHWPDAGQPGD